MSQERVHARVRPTVDSAERTADDDAVDQAIDDAAERAAADQKALDATEDFLRDIDDILEENVLEVLTKYVQRGGE